VKDRPSVLSCGLQMTS